MIRKLAEMLGYKDSEKAVIVRKPQVDRSELKVDPTDSKLSLPFFPTDGKDVRYIKLTDSKKYLNYKKIMKEELL